MILHQHIISGEHLRIECFWYKMSRRRSRKHIREQSEELEHDTYGIADDDKSRPYYIVEDLPCSLEPPRYDTFTTALSVKDSAVLYTSLLNSRRTWIKAEMFQLYWSKQYMNTKEKEELKKEGIDPDSIDQSAAREKMNKLCDCSMQGGPHQFPIRLFILKNDYVEKAWMEAKEAKKKEREERRVYQEEQKKLKDERREIRRQKKREALEKEKNKEKIKKPRKPYKKSASKTDANKSQSITETKISEKDRKDPSPPKAKKTKSITRAKPYEEQVMILNLNKMARTDNTLNDLMIKVAGGNASVDEIMEFKKYIEQAKNMPPPSGSWKTMFEEVEVTDDEEEVERKESRNSPIDKEVEPTGKTEHMMISSGQQSPSEDTNEENLPVNENSELKKGPEEETQGSRLPTEAFNITENVEYASEKVSNDAETIIAENKGSFQQSSSTDNSDKLEGVEKKEITTLESQQTQTADSSHVEENNAETVKKPSNNKLDSESANDSIKRESEMDGSIDADEGVGGEPPKKRKYRKRLKVKNEDEEEEDRTMQLTTFQQKYSNGADIVFEYVENANVRFLLPKYSIIEQLEDEESYLLSFIMVHNRREVALFTSRKLKELNKKKAKEDWIKPEDYNPFDDARCPDPMYSPITIKLSDIPKKFASIIMNSFHPTERVQQYMKSIFNRGDRLSGYNLWYELDAYDDKGLAESLRAGLKEYEQNFKNKRQKKQII